MISAVSPKRKWICHTLRSCHTPSLLRSDLLCLNDDLLQFVWPFHCAISVLFRSFTIKAPNKLRKVEGEEEWCSIRQHVPISPWIFFSPPPSSHSFRPSAVRLLWPLTHNFLDSVENVLSDVFFCSLWLAVTFPWKVFSTKWRKCINVKHKQTQNETYGAFSAHHWNKKTCILRGKNGKASSGFHYTYIWNLNSSLDGFAGYESTRGLRVDLSPSVRPSVRQIFLLSWLRNDPDWH